jgi:hypothetical protein
VTSEKFCARCGRVITPRKSLQRNWESVKWCSQACSKASIRKVDERLEAAILELLRARAKGATICPSEAARRVESNGWESLMEPARCAARRLHNAGVIQITQGGNQVDPSRAKGPIRLRLN